MAQPLPVQITEIQIARFSVDPEAMRMVIDYTEGNSTSGTYTPLREGSKTIEGAEMAALCNHPIYDQSGAQLNFYETIRNLVYGVIIPSPAPVIPAPVPPAPEPEAPPAPEPEPEPEVPVEPPVDPPVEPEPDPEVTA